MASNRTKTPAKKPAQTGARAHRVLFKAARKPTRKTDIAISRSDPRILFDGNGRGRKLADLPKSVRDVLEWVDVDSDGRILGFAFRDKVAAIGRLLGV